MKEGTQTRCSVGAVGEGVASVGLLITLGRFDEDRARPSRSLAGACDGGPAQRTARALGESASFSARQNLPMVAYVTRVR